MSTTKRKGRGGELHTNKQTNFIIIFVFWITQHVSFFILPLFSSIKKRKKRGVITKKTCTKKRFFFVACRKNSKNIIFTHNFNFCAYLPKRKGREKYTQTNKILSSIVFWFTQKHYVYCTKQKPISNVIGKNLSIKNWQKNELEHTQN